MAIGKRLGKLPLGLVGMLALVAAVEGYIVRHEARFSRIEAFDWKLTARMADHELPAGGILAFGDSQLKFAVLPPVIESRTGLPSRSLAVQGGQAPSTFFLLRRALEAGARPAAIVVNFEPHLFMDLLTHNTRQWSELGSARDAYDLYQRTKDATGFSSTLLGMVVPSYRDRLEIRQNVFEALRGEESFNYKQVSMGVRNREVNQGGLALYKTPGHAADVAVWGNLPGKEWQANPDNLAFARRFFRLAEKQGVPIYWVIPPVDPEIQAKYESNGIDARYRAVVRSFQEQFPAIRVVDAQHSNYQRDVFFDGLHLDKDGAIGFSVALGDMIRRDLKAPSRGERWVALPPYRAEPVNVAIEDAYQSILHNQEAEKIRR